MYKKKTPYAGFVEFGGSFNPRGAGEEYLLLDFLGHGRFFVPAVKKKERSCSNLYAVSS